jgi:hypothetical protein
LQAENIMKSAAGLVRASCLAAGLIVSPHLARADAAAILKVEIAAPAQGSTGTMHYADELRLSAGRSGPLILKSELSSGKLIPLPGPQYRIDDSHVLLLGWSSHGGGMQTIHALLVHLENISRSSAN